MPVSLGHAPGLDCRSDVGSLGFLALQCLPGAMKIPSWSFPLASPPLLYLLARASSNHVLSSVRVTFTSLPGGHFQSHVNTDAADTGCPTSSTRRIWCFSSLAGDSRITRVALSRILNYLYALHTWLWAGAVGYFQSQYENA